MKKLGHINGKQREELTAWCQSQDFLAVTKSSYAPRRVEQWFGMGSNLQSGLRAKIFQASDPGERLRALGDRMLPGWHSLLVCAGCEPESSTSIDWHRDHSHFLGRSVMVNLGESIYFEQPVHGSTDFLEYRLDDGVVVEIDTKLVHKAVQVSATRFNLTFRMFKPGLLSSLWAA